MTTTKEESLKDYWDLKSSMDTYFEEGKIEGKIETATIALREGISVELIMKLTGLSRDEIERLK